MYCYCLEFFLFLYYIMNTTLVILDWDDTLFPTTWISKNNIDLHRPLNDTHVNNFVELDKTVYNFLKFLKPFGIVVIITNAFPGWVTLSSSHLPLTHKYINDNITVVSARLEFEKLYPSNSYLWKNKAFKQYITNTMSDKSIHNIISIGDADYEYSALVDLYDWKDIIPEYRYLKNVKFMNYPSIREIIDQISVLTSNFSNICNVKKHLDFTFKPNI